MFIIVTKGVIKLKKDKIYKRPAFIILESFIIVILLGTFLLNLNIASSNGKSVGIENAIFTATSATCVTGLIVVNTARKWSFFGKLVIIILIQIGGLGTMSLFSAFFLFLKKRIGLRHRMIIKESLNLSSYTGVVRFVKSIIIFSLSIEVIGAMILAIRFVPMFGSRGIWLSIFHSISAYCNAGFDLFGNSMESFYNDPLVLLTISTLVIVGGLGFVVFSDLYKSKNFKNLTLHSKLSLTISLALLISGTVVFIVLEDSNANSIRDFSTGETILTAFFQSTVARTAGFNSINLASIHHSTAFMLMLLMFVGANPASTGGGIKTTTFGILVLSTLSILRGENRFRAYKRSIKIEIIYRSIAILMLSLGIIAVSSFLISGIEHERFAFIDVMFEVFSAFGTVGTSRGITADLSLFSHIVLIIIMIFGRVGPFTVAYAISNHKKNKIQYANGQVIVG